MLWYVVYLFILVLIAVLIGWFIGCWLRRTFSMGPAVVHTPAPASVVSQAAPEVKSGDAEAIRLAAEEEARKAEEDAARREAEARAAREKAAAEAEKRKAEEEEARRLAAAAEKAAAEKAAAERLAAEKAATAKSEDEDVADAAARLAALPANAGPAEKADAVGSRPVGLTTPRGGAADDLKRIRGIGKVNEKKLHDLGIYHFDQIAAWADKEVRWVGTFLSFQGRIEREDWVAQAKVLAEGGETKFSKRVDKGDVPTSKT